MSVFLLFISGILILCFIVFVGWGVWTFTNNPSQVKGFLKKVTDLIRQEDHKIQKQEECKPSQEDVIRNIVKEEVERMGNKIIRSFPQPTNISQDDIINEIRNNRQLVERLVVSLNKRQEKIIPEPARATPRQYPIIKFARMVDCSSPLGFQMASLSSISKGACYQITIDSEVQASYRLITDWAIQSEIISMFNPVVTSGCEYDENPTAINQIIHAEDGLLELHSGIWHIVKKAKIRFL